MIEPSNTSQFDFWLRISTVEVGRPIRVPLTLYEHAKKTLTQFQKLCRGVTLNRREGEWWATLVVERKSPKIKSTKIIGVDIGMVSIVATSESQRYGQVGVELHRRVEHAAGKRHRKQKLNACSKCKNKPVVNLRDSRAAFSPKVDRTYTDLLQVLTDEAVPSCQAIGVVI